MNGLVSRYIRYIEVCRLGFTIDFLRQEENDNITGMSMQTAKDQVLHGDLPGGWFYADEYDQYVKWVS